MYVPHSKELTGVRDRLTLLVPPMWKSPRTHWSIWAFFYASRRLYVGVLVHIHISPNDPELTEPDWPTPAGASNIKPAQHENALVDFSVPLCVKKAVCRCISTYVYLPKRLRTHRDRLTPFSWCLHHKTCTARERASQFWRSFARQKGYM